MPRHTSRMWAGGTALLALLLATLWIGPVELALAGFTPTPSPTTTATPTTTPLPTTTPPPAATQPPRQPSPTPIPPTATPPPTETTPPALLPETGGPTATGLDGWLLPGILLPLLIGLGILHRRLRLHPGRHTGTAAEDHLNM